jgi:hypothetical protein
MTRRTIETPALLGLALLIAACSSNAPSGPGGTGDGTVGGAAGGTIGSAGVGKPAGGNSGDTGTGGSTSATGGQQASAGTGGGPAAGGVPGGEGDAASGGGQAGGAGGASAGGQTGMSIGGQGGVPSDFDALFEAEAIPPNQVFGFAKRASCARTCAAPLTPGEECCSGGGEVTWIVSKNGAHPSGWMQFNDVAAPADGDYDVTFWYHSGGSDTYGDDNCGGQPMTEAGQFGCRPEVFTVNGTTLPGAYHFPVFTGAQTVIHPATVTLPLRKGMNTIMVAPPPPRDSVDVDAIELQPPGKGRAPHIAANTTDLIGGK